MNELIKNSHNRSQNYGVSRDTRKRDSTKISQQEVDSRILLNKEFVKLFQATVHEFFKLMSPDDFLVSLVDSGGYILIVEGSSLIKVKSEERNLSPGYRWKEQDVGTTATSLCLYSQIPIQLNDKDHYCKVAHGFTSSAAPVFGHKGVLLGVIVISGTAELVHPHTLSMITSAAHSIERQMRLMRRNAELSTNRGFLDNVIEAVDTALLTFGKDLKIRKVNRKGKKILQSRELIGKPISQIGGLHIDLDSLQKNPKLWKNKELRVKGNNKETFQLLYSAQPVLSRDGEVLGAVLNFTKFSTITKLVDKIAGTEPFFTFDSLIGSSSCFTEAISLAKRVAKSNTSILLIGETGTGKELFAQAIHNSHYQFKKPFVPINCGAIPGELLESELFGYAEGAFTGAQKGGRLGKFMLADGGTILLDEIGDMPHDMQVKLLRFLQTGEVHPVGSDQYQRITARIIAATHVNLSKRVQQNKFRQDLYYRLNILQITIPPLRERGRKDIIELAKYFIEKSDRTAELTPEAVQALIGYNWPGNVRELENTIQRALHVCHNYKISEKDLGITKKATTTSSYGSLQEMEEQMIISVLNQTNSNMLQSAQRLGISRATLYRKVQQYNIAKP